MIRFKDVLAALLAVAAGLSQAQTSTESQVVEVRAGDTFSAIAGRFTGDPRKWSQLYHPRLSGLPNPDIVRKGSKLELVTQPDGKRYLRVVGTTVAVAAAPAPAAAPKAEAAPATATAAPAPAAAPPAAELVLGVLPNIAPAMLASQYDNVKRYLERVGGHKVRVVVPPNFKAFFDNMMKGEYDVAVAAPHFARVAQAERTMLPLVMYEPRINALLVATSEATVTGPRDLASKAIGFANPQSLVAMYGQQWLRQQQMEPGRDYEVKGARTDLGVGRMLLTGDVAAAIMSNGEFRSLPADEQPRLKIVEAFARIPNFVLMVHPRIDRDRQARLKAQLKDLLADKDDGAAFGKATGFTGVVDADETQLRELDAYVAPTKRAMGWNP